VANKCGVGGDEGGHLIASILNGLGERSNLLPMNGNLNKGTWKTMENTWASALKEGKQVSVKIEPMYSGKSARPDSFNVEYSIGSARPKAIVCKNSPGGN
jgi:filamentous hemagglutinin